MTVQGEIERCLSVLLQRAVSVTGAGRTDTGVHAAHMVAHFDVPDTSETFSEADGLRSGEVLQDVDEVQLAYRLNRMLPPDIVVYKIEPVAEDMHARFSAKWRTYHYYVTTFQTPFSRHYTWEAFTWKDSDGVRRTLDFQLMNEAAAILLEYKDFASFCKVHTDVKTTLCNVVEARWMPVPSAALPISSVSCPISEVSQASTDWVFVIKANRFLRHMVRALVGTLVEVGRHRMTLEQFRVVLESKQRTRAGESMPANALFLQQIEY
jgi:tRNA pseudouridine38-40 synthase